MDGAQLVRSAGGAARGAYRTDRLPGTEPALAGGALLEGAGGQARLHLALEDDVHDEHRQHRHDHAGEQPRPVRLVSAVDGQVDQALSEHRAVGVDEIVIGHETRPGKYDLILESVGGPSLTASLKALEKGGIVVLYGTTESPEVTFDARVLYSNSGTLYGLYVFNELERHQSGARDLATLGQLVAWKKLLVGIDLEVGWTEAGRAIGALMDRQITGKAVMRVG